MLAMCFSVEAKKRGKPAGSGSPHAVVNVVFIPADVRVIRGYYRNTGLPPGIQKQLIRKGRLPPGLAKKIAPFPLDLERQLPRLPVGVHRGHVGGRAVLYDPVSRIILDVADIIDAAGRL
jgi:hypothetical protein